MSVSVTSGLAVLGGPKAVTADVREQWRRPVDEEKAAVCELLDEGAISCAGVGLPKRFEDEFRAFVGCKYVLSYSHGHLALASAFFAAGVGAGDEFIHPTFGGYIGSYVGPLHAGAKPVFCEPDRRTLLADPTDIARRINSRTRAISPIHLNGRVCDMDALLGLCRQHNLTLIEDAAHAHGSEWGGRRIGNVGHVACFSLQGVDPGGKPVTAGEGGVLATNDRHIYERAMIYGQLHRTGILDELKDSAYGEMENQVLGWKWRAHPLALAVARVSLKTLPFRMRSFAESREELVEGLKGMPGMALAGNYPKSRGSELYGGLRFIYQPEELGGLSAARFCEALRAEGVPANLSGLRTPEHLRSIYTRDFPGLWGRGHSGPANIPLPRYRRGDYPVAERLFDNGIVCLSGWIQPAPGAVAQVAAGIRKVVDRHKDLL